MVNFVELRKHITKEIKKECSNVFYKKAKETNYPYAIYEIDKIREEENKDFLQLEINIYDDTDDSTNIELLTNSIEKLFKRVKYFDKFHSFVMYTNARNNLDSEKDKIKRRRLLIDINYYGKEV